MRTPLSAAGLATALALVLIACGSADPGPALSLPPPGKLPRSKTSHVVMVVMENKERGQALDARDARYTRTLVRRYASPQSLFAIRHPSLPNYLALLGGDTFGIDSDCTSCHVDAPNLVDRLEAAGRSWKAYMEGMPNACFKGADHGGYAKKHNPFMYFDSIANDPARCNRVVPYTRISRDLKRGRLPDFAWITPDLCHDTHDCGVRTGDRFLSHLAPALIRELGPHGILVVAWDEGSSDRGCCGLAHGGRIATVVAGPDVRRGATGSGSYTQYSILRTISDALGVQPVGHAGDASTRPLDALFKRPPSRAP
ncbi:MAG: phosphatidylinositol-3-phosphatase [Thermoleophilaceae bacterium]|nr:phosphatidylinositol-3-phosphatase [Thermoleophilaceae bacterium]